MSKKFNYYPILTTDPSNEDTLLLFDKDEENIKQVSYAYITGKVSGELQFAGTWDASTNTPTISSGVGSNGRYYIVSVEGTTTIDGNSTWVARDIIIFTGSVWERIPFANPYAEAYESATESYNWAQYPEDQLVPEGNEVDEYSSYHWASKAEDSASAASTSESNAATSASNAATSESNAASSASSAATSASNAATSANNASISESNAAASATSASQSEQAAASSANYAGIWSNLTGSLSIPASVYHNGIMWTLLNNLTDITTSEPTTSSSDWLAMYGMLEYPSIRPSLLLDFYSKEIDPRITFSRASNKSYYDHKCRLCYADVDEPTIDHDPVTGECKGLSIWESRTNLLTYSEDFGNAAWTKKEAAVVPNTAVAPDGTLTADKLVANTDNAEHYMEQILTQTEGTFTKSLYVKKGNSGDYVEIRPVHIGEISATSAITFDLNVGPLATTNVLITNAGMDILLDGWRRCWVTYTTTAACTEHKARVNLISSAGDNRVYTGDGTSGIYIWGAQLEEGSSPSPYIPSDISFTSRASTALYYDSNGYIQIAGIDEPRYNYNPADLTAPPKLLLEDSSTNLLTYSEQFDHADWTKASATITPNAVTAPDGTTTADKLIASTVDATHKTLQTVSSVTLGVQYSLSIFAKKGEYDYLRISGAGAGFIYPDYAYFDLTNGTIGITNSVDDVLIESVSDGWYRCAVVLTADATDTGEFIAYVFNSNSLSGYAGDGTSGLYIWGAQLEEGDRPTSYIPTTSAPVTRAADISTSTATTRAADVAYIDGTDFSDFYNQQEGTVVVEASSFDSDNYQNLVVLSDHNVQTSAILLQLRGGYKRYLSSEYNNAGDVYITSTSGTAGQVRNIAFKVTNDLFSVVGNVEGLQTDIPTGIPQGLTALEIGSKVGSNQLNGHIRHLSYYPKALTDNNLIALTTEE
jgi:hypothetical protein